MEVALPSIRSMSASFVWKETIVDGGVTSVKDGGSLIAYGRKKRLCMSDNYQPKQPPVNDSNRPEAEADIAILKKQEKLIH